MLQHHRRHLFGEHHAQLRDGRSPASIATVRHSGDRPTSRGDRRDAINQAASKSRRIPRAACSLTLVKDERELRDRIRFELIPLLDEYLQQGLLGPASHELYAVRDGLEDMVRTDLGLDLKVGQ